MNERDKKMQEKIHWTLYVVLISCFVSVKILIVSASTDYWIYADAGSDDLNASVTVNYGLYSGTMTRYFLTPTEFDLNLICNYGENICMYSCKSTEFERRIELFNILDNISPTPCLKVARSLEQKPRMGLNETIQERQGGGYPKEPFISPALWISTNVFIYVALASTLAVATSIICGILIPTRGKHTQFILVHIFSATAAASVLIALVTWAVLYASKLCHNIAVTDTLHPEFPMNSEGMARLGSSYFLLIIPLLLSATNTPMIFLRKYLLAKEEEPNKITVDYLDTKLEFF